MKPPHNKPTRQRSPSSLHPVSHGFKKSKPKEMEVKKKLKVWFNINPEIISSENNSYHMSLNELLSRRQQRNVLGSKSLSNLEINTLSHDDFLKSCKSSKSTLLGPSHSENPFKRKYFDNQVSSYDDSYLEDDISMKCRNIPRKGILKNKSINYHAGYFRGSYHDCRHLWERNCDLFNSFESENSWSSLGVNSDSITKLHKCSEPVNPMNYSTERETFDDLTSSIKRLNISQFSFSEAINSNHYMNLLYSSQNHCNEMCKVFLGNASNEKSEEQACSVLHWPDNNNNCHSSEDSVSAKRDQNSSNSLTDKNATSNNVSSSVIPQISFHLKSASGAHSSNSVPFLEGSPTIVPDAFKMNSDCSCHVEDGEVESISKDSHQSDFNECNKAGVTGWRVDTLMKCPVVNCGVCFTDQTLFAKHMSNLGHSSCNPAASLVDGIIPTTASFLCPSCGDMFLDENSCLEHMFSEKHERLLLAVPFFVFTCPQCFSFFETYSSALEHMDIRNHHATALSFIDDTKNIIQPSPIAMPYKIMKEFISRCGQADYVLHCENCLEYLYSPEEFQFHINNLHTVVSKCDTDAVDVFSTLITNKSCAECRQFIYTHVPDQHQLCIHTDCPLQGPVITLRARSLKEFVRRCGIAGLNIATVNDLNLKVAITTSTPHTLSSKQAKEFKKMSRAFESKPCLDKSKMGNCEVDSTKNNKENLASVANNSNPYGEGTSKQCSVQLKKKLKKKGHMSHVESGKSKQTKDVRSLFSSDKYLVTDFQKLKRKCNISHKSEPKKKMMVLEDTTMNVVKDVPPICEASTRASTLELNGEEHFNNPVLSRSQSLFNNTIPSMSNLYGDINFEQDIHEDDKFIAIPRDSERKKYEDKANAVLDYIPFHKPQYLFRKKHSGKEIKAHRYWHCVAKKSPYKYKYSSSNQFYYKFHPQHKSAKKNIHIDSMIRAATANQVQRSGSNAVVHKRGITSFESQHLMLKLNGPFCGAASKKTSLAECWNLPKMISPEMDHLASMGRIIFADLENYYFFKNYKGIVLPSTYVWGFISARPGSPFYLEKYFYKFPLYLYLKREKCVHLSTDIGTTKDAVDFAICLAVAKLDDRLPTSIPFFIVSRDKGFTEVENQMKVSQRKVVVIAPRNNNILTFADFI